MRSVRLVAVVPEHLSNIDPDAWPAVRTVSAASPLLNLKARRAEARFASACEQAGIDLLSVSPDVVVEHEELFVRLAESGWLGLAESFMAGEWTAPDLSAVLAGLLKTQFSPRGRRPLPGLKLLDRGDGSELPADLVGFCSTDGASYFGGLFASGVPTTVRTSTKSYVQGAGRGHEPAMHFVDVTHVAAPAEVERWDLADAQRRAGDSLLDAAQVSAGADVLEFPSSGGAVALQASLRGATIDVLTADELHFMALDEFITLNGAAAHVHPFQLQHPIPTREEWRGRYDSIISVEKLERMGKTGRIAFFKALDRMLTIGGYIGLQTVVATDNYSSTADEALSVLRGYVWPALRFSTPEEIHRMVDRETGLRIVAQKHFGEHYQTTLGLQRELFESQLREAAAAGYDSVFRRMWIFQMALLEALIATGHLDAVQLTLTSRNRSGRR